MGVIREAWAERFLSILYSHSLWTLKVNITRWCQWENLEQSLNFQVLKSQVRCKIFRRLPTEWHVCFALCLPCRSEKSFQAGWEKRNQRSLIERVTPSSEKSWIFFSFSSSGCWWSRECREKSRALNEVDSPRGKKNDLLSPWNS